MYGSFFIKDILGFLFCSTPLMTLIDRQTSMLLVPFVWSQPSAIRYNLPMQVTHTHTHTHAECVIECECIGPCARVQAYVMSVLALNSKGLASG